MKPRSPHVIKVPGADYRFIVVGAPRPLARDLYHALLRVPWWAAIATIVGAYLALNAVFAALYLATGGIAHARPGSFVDAFFFSVQTMGTIGYGSLYPESPAANALVVAESVTGLVATALATGLVFVRFSQIRPRVIFSSRIAVAPLDGVPTLMIRLGNERGNAIVDVQMRLTVMRTTRSAEGVVIYRTEDLPLVRERAPSLTRAWTVLHRLDDKSPLYGATPAQLAEREAEIGLSIVGTDDTSLQPVHARHVWHAGEVAFDTRLADVITETPEGDMLLDLRRFHDLVPAPAPAPAPPA